MGRTFRANRFIALNDGSTLGNLQCVVDFENFDEDLLKEVTTGAALKISGRYVESQGKGQAEIQVEALHVYGTADPEVILYNPKNTALSFYVKKLTCVYAPPPLAR